MSVLKPANVRLPAWDPDDPRVGHLLGKDLHSPGDARVLLIGFPTDQGVHRNGGRVGAAKAPDLIRQALFKYTPDPERHDRFTELLRRTWDLGNLQTGDDLEQDQTDLGTLLAPHLKRGAVCVILGGGHETAFGHFLGYASQPAQVTILNWDAHADVRPLKSGLGHSGSPFRQALEHPTQTCAGYVVAGLNPASVARTHLQYLAQHRGKAIYNHAVDQVYIETTYDELAGRTLVTFDLDAVDQSQAPGVSAPTCDGLNTELWLSAAEHAGRCMHVSSIDVVEFNPDFDLDHRTARLAAMTVWKFLQGLCTRRDFVL